MAKRTAVVPTHQLSPAKAVASLNAAEKKLFATLKAAADKIVEDELWAWWEIGTSVAKAYHENSKCRQQMYNKHWMERMTIAIWGHNREASLRRAIDLADAWPTKTAFRAQVIKFRGSGDNRLYLTHVRNLARIADPQQRQQMMTLCLEEGWNTKDLIQEIAKLDGQPQKIKQGYAVPKTAKRCFKQIDTQTTKFNALVKGAWTGREFNLVVAVRDVATPALDETLANLRVTKKGVAAMQKACEKLMKKLDKTEEAILARIPEGNEEDPDDPTADGPEDVINLGEERNKRAREKRAAEKKKKDAAKARKAKARQ
jgi:hypothetical protein